MGKGLLESLITYGPREGKVPLEDFITEAFAWILNNYPDFSTYFLNEVLAKDKIWLPEMEFEGCEWRTQCDFDGKRPDMVCFSNSEKCAIIFEHKTWSSLHDCQLDNYKVYAEKRFGKKKFKVVLITASSRQHFQKNNQEPDIALCWSHVHNIISDWLKKNETKTSFLFTDFLSLLVSEGLGPPAPISHESILFYYTAAELRGSICSLTERIENELDRRIKEENWSDDTKKNFETFTKGSNRLMYCDKDGRIGLSQTESRRPGIFIGVYLGRKDHCINPIDRSKGPDFCLIIDFAEDLHGRFQKSENYKKLIKDLSYKISRLPKEHQLIGFQFYNSLEESPLNRWHPIHIRKPMLDVFRGSVTDDEQADKFYNTAVALITLVTEEDSFWKLKKEFKDGN